MTNQSKALWATGLVGSATMGALLAFKILPPYDRGYVGWFCVGACCLFACARIWYLEHHH